MPPRREDVIGYLDTSLRLAWQDTATGHLASAGDFRTQFIGILPSPLGSDFERWIARYDAASFERFVMMAYCKAKDNMPVVSFATHRGRDYDYTDPLHFAAVAIHCFVDWYIQEPNRPPHSEVDASLVQ